DRRRNSGVPEAARARNRGTATKRNLSTAAGQAGGNPEAGRSGSAQVKAFLVCWTALFRKQCCRFCRSAGIRRSPNTATVFGFGNRPGEPAASACGGWSRRDRKSTRLNSSHLV